MYALILMEENWREITVSKENEPKVGNCETYGEVKRMSSKKEKP